MSRPAAFDAAVVKQMPALKGFALKLCRDSTRAEDLVHETVAKALEKYELFTPGTNLSAWLYMILRNEFYSQQRRAGRFVEDPDGLIASMVAIPEGQSAAVDLKIVLKRMRLLPKEMRDALNLVGALGNNYEAVAERLGVAVGTIKSRVSRARDFLETGEIQQPEEQPPAPEPPAMKVSERLSELFRAGGSVYDIATEIASAPRDVMRMIIDLRLRRA